MEKIVLFLILLISLSCDIQYDGETKLVIKGQVKDENNNPLNNQSIKLFVSRNSSYLPFVFYVSSETNFIGKSFTDSQGNFTMVIPKPEKNFDEISVEINGDSNSLSPKQIVNIKTEDFYNYELNLGELKLYEKANLCLLQIIPNQINSENELLEISYIGDVSEEIIFYNLPDEYYYYYETIKNVRKNQTIQLNYKIKNYISNTTSIEQVLIPIDNSADISYTLNY
ncbi:Ig-like domain-containing protein [Flavobacterium sp. U410]